MKNHIVHVSSVLLVVLMIFSFSSCSTVKVPDKDMVAVFRWGDVDITEQLSIEDAEIVKQIFNGKRLFSNSPSCGFGEGAAIIVGNQTYCIACDYCPLIYIVQEDKYFELSDDENETLRNLLCEYGFTFPCI